MSLCTDGREDWCIVATGTVRFLFRCCNLSLICVGLIGALQLCYRLILFLFLVPFLYLRYERIDALMPLLPSIFPFFCYRLGNLCREARCVDAAVTVNFSFFVAIVLLIREEIIGA